MNLDKHELKLLAAAGCIAPPGSPVRVALLAGLFERPGKLNAVVDQLRIGGLITFDSFAGVLRVLPDRVWQSLSQYGVTPELFPHERPLDAALAEVSRRNLDSRLALSPATVLKDRNPCEFTRAAPEPNPSPPVAATRGIPVVAHVSMPSMPLMPMPSAGMPHGHEACNSENIKAIHEHERGHEVGELGFRTTGQIMADLLRLAPGLAKEFQDQWRARIEREDAALVNAVVRQGFLQRRQIRQMAGWLNRCYLNGIEKKMQRFSKGRAL